MSRWTRRGGPSLASCYRVVMLHRMARRTVELATAIGADPADSTDLRLKKTLLVTVALMVLPVSIIWGAFYWFAGEQVAALWPWMYALISLFSLVAFHLTHSFALLRWVQLIIVLVAPFLVGVALGGLVASSVVILWSLLAPLAAIRVTLSETDIELPCN